MPGPHEDDATRLRRIVGDYGDDRISCADARAAVVRVVLDRLDVDRVSLWHFEHPGSRQDRSLVLHCFGALRRGGALETCDDRLEIAEYRDYFNQLIERGTYASEDARHDPLLRPMDAAYLQPHDIRSLLDAAFSLNGRAYGMICSETLGRRVAWRGADVQALRSIATRLAALLSSADVPQLWSSPSLPLAALERPR